MINLYYKREKSQVTINFLDSDNTGLKVQKSETMTVNVGEYVWPINYGAMTSQSTKSVYHMYQIPTILNYSYQNSDSDTPLLVANDSATNVINLYYKRDKSQVTVNSLIQTESLFVQMIRLRLMLEIIFGLSLSE